MRSSSLNPFSASKLGAAVVIAVAIASTAAATATGAVYSGSGARARARATAPANTSPPAISGTPKQNEVLTSSPGAWTGTTPLTYGYQWSRCNTATALANGRFESDASGWVGINGGSIAQSTAQAHSGSGSLAVVTPGGSTNVEGAQYTTPSGSITAGRTYRFLAWVYTGSAVTVSVTIRNFDTTGTQLQGSFIPTITSPGWNRLSVRLVAPAGATSEQLQVSVDKTATTFYVDDASLDDCAPISGATSATYTVQAADAGSTLMSVATATNSAGSASASSDVTAMALDQFDTAPAYTGPIYTDNTAAAGGDPAPPPPINTTLPTWRNTYDWPNGHGYVGWHYATSATDSRYGGDTNHGGNSGLWLWPAGGQQYTPNYAEWTYTAPGTTRISTVNITFAYRNKLLAHHCIEIGLRTLDGTVVSQDRWCQPALPPDSQREVKITLEDPANNPTSKVLFFRLAFPACSDPSSPSCSKYIPQLDPLTVGGYARLEFADMVLVDDDNPIIQPSGPLWDIKDHFIDGTQTYGVTLGSTEPGSGIVSSAFSHASTYPPATDSLGSQNAPCDPAHNTPPLDARICPATFSWDTTVPTPPYPEGPNTFTETATDNAGNVGSLSWTIYIDRTSPDSVTASGDFFNLDGTYIDGRGIYGLGVEAHDPGRDVQKASGISSVWFDRGGTTVASAPAGCIPLICPDDYTAAFSVDTNQFPEGTDTFGAHAVDLVGHESDGSTWSVIIDRSAPSIPTGFRLDSFDGATATIAWDDSADPSLPDGTAGSGLDSYQVRTRTNAGSWSDWSGTFNASTDIAGANAGDTVDVEVKAVDLVGNISEVGAGSVVIPSAAGGVTATGGPTVASVSPDDKAVLPFTPNTSVSPTTLGDTVTIQVGDATAPREYDWNVNLAAGETLRQLSNGSVAIVAPFAEAVDPLETNDYTEPSTTTQPDLASLASDDSDPGLDGAFVPDPSDLPEPADASIINDPSYDSPDFAPVSDGGTLVTSAQALTDGQVVGVLAPPKATDAAGNPIAVNLVAETASIALVVGASDTTPFPVTAQVAVGFNPDLASTLAQDTPTSFRSSRSVSSSDASATTGSTQPDLQPSSCGSTARILIWGPHGFGDLGPYLARYPASCARYYMTIMGNSSDPTDWDASKVAHIHAINVDPNYHSRLATRRSDFVSVADVNWLKWFIRAKAEGKNAYEVGQEIHTTLAARGFDFAHGDTWVIDDFPRLSLNDVNARSRLLALIRGIYNGTGTQTAPGMIFKGIDYQDTNPTSGTPSVKMAWESILRSDSFWSSLRRDSAPYVRFWIEETYPRCRYICGKTFGTQARLMNDYLQHPARLAFAAPSGTAASAKSFFDTGYMSIENAFWATNSAQEGIYRTSLLRGEMSRFVSLQVYATAAWAAANPYPDRRIAFAWNQQVTSSMTQAMHQALALRLALALEGAFSKGGSPLWACDPNSGQSVVLCAPPVSRYGTASPPDWSVFNTWP